MDTIELGYEANRRNCRRKEIVYRYYQQVIHNFLDRPSEGTLGRFSTLYHFLSFILVVACLCLTVFSTMDADPRFEEALNFIENIMIVQFFLEYILRVWSSGCRTRYR
ncbi:Oidioi.mRNA.OKI2018_I69.chr1.g652.t1.cds [Oikopleura dioica]|uniref:Oidioi.mRNA.OKI2018_I69.chr1.g652.t1.cds n=1 Tax=Oikopleura dioica TaxID=34765 RepID=A0ABN7SSP2_OIKDI|nr:Oidioi.mRNA.OKI2018_I69.chr1.g652.t1.cds [Oikopleura dioica]